MERPNTRNLDTSEQATSRKNRAPLSEDAIRTIAERSAAASMKLENRELPAYYVRPIRHGAGLFCSLEIGP
ncbi:hypothetical protein [Candidatus Mycolicibacterium alkanivorans]|uniref:Uncharacterized protein n=1 Tax=Candidatus Mycolicibacterium alkanivorans TaxID=2954114 RepID=A0ABS9YWN1_9MYCO|nr:hypothetical protein [Candidatus Mycolicibacterium alkanivorans]MCI4675629.1 hypothetical protein [Candidatus Mycolicibacterium alkanivorans]